MTNANPSGAGADPGVPHLYDALKLYSRWYSGDVQADASYVAYELVTAIRQHLAVAARLVGSPEEQGVQTFTVQAGTSVLTRASGDTSTPIVAHQPCQAPNPRGGRCWFPIGHEGPHDFEGESKAEVAPGDGRAKEQHDLWLEQLAERWWQHDTDEELRLFAEEPQEWLVRFGKAVLAAQPAEAGNGRAARLQALVEKWRADTYNWRDAARSNAKQNPDFSQAMWVRAAERDECADEIEALLTIGGQPEGQ